MSAAPSISELSDGPHRFFVIRHVALVFRPKAGPAVPFETDRSNVFFARIRQAMREREEITHFSCNGLDLDGESMAALNCFLRAERPMGRMLHPWDRILHAGFNTRYEFSELCQHLALNFR